LGQTARPSELQARAEIKGITFDALADAEVVNPPRAKIKAETSSFILVKI
jgi:hypothetical protein